MAADLKKLPLHDDSTVTEVIDPVPGMVGLDSCDEGVKPTTAEETKQQQPNEQQPNEAPPPPVVQDGPDEYTIHVSSLNRNLLIVLLGSLTTLSVLYAVMSTLSEQIHLLFLATISAFLSLTCGFMFFWLDVTAHSGDKDGKDEFLQNFSYTEIDVRNAILYGQLISIVVGLIFISAILAAFPELQPFPAVVYLFPCTYVVYSWANSTFNTVHQVVKILHKIAGRPPLKKLLIFGFISGTIYSAILGVLAGYVWFMRVVASREELASLEFSINAIVYPVLRTGFRTMVMRAIAVSLGNQTGRNENASKRTTQYRNVVKICVMLQTVFDTPGFFAIALSESWKSYIAASICNCLVEILSQHVFLHLVVNGLAGKGQIGVSQLGDQKRRNSLLRRMKVAATTTGKGSFTDKNETSDKNQEKIQAAVKLHEVRLSGNDFGEKMVSVLTPIFALVAIELVSRFGGDKSVNSSNMNDIFSVIPRSTLLLRSLINLVIFEIPTDIVKSYVFFHLYGVKIGNIRVVDHGLDVCFTVSAAMLAFSTAVIGLCLQEMNL